MTDNQKGGWLSLFFAFSTCWYHGTAIAILFDLLRIKKYDIFWGAQDYLWLGPTFGVFSLFMLGLSFMLMFPSASKKFKVAFSVIVLTLYVTIPIAAVLLINT